jgi:predicted XRE-type DNA-binding protein
MGDERQTKVRLAAALNSILDAKKLSQVEAAKWMGIPQPKVSALIGCKIFHIDGE